MSTPSSAPRSIRPMYEALRLRLILFGIDLLFGRRRSFTRDSQLVLDANRGCARRIEGLDNVPAAGSFIVVMNHYSRRGLRPYHCAMVISAAVASVRPGLPQVRWAFTSEYLGRHIGPVPIPLWLIRWTFRRVARVYDFVVIPRREERVMGRAAALRRFARAVARGPIGLTPEGLRGTGPLAEPPPGNGLFLASLSRPGIPLLPIGLREDDDTLVVRFGAPFGLDVPHNVTREEQDRAARQTVMVAIGRELPPACWGVYAEIIAQRTGHRP